MAKLTHTACFAHFGAKPRNVQWSWSARNEETKTVVVTLWQDEFKNVDGKMIYERSAAWIEGDRKRPGHTELMENLRWAVDNCAGWVNVIIAIAKDKHARPRSIAECFPWKMKLRVTHLNEQTGAFGFEAPELA